MSGNCVGLHPHGPCPPGVGCNATPDPVGLRVAELEAELREERESHAATWKRAAENGRLLIEAHAELAKVKGYQAELAERCYRKDLELDELRPRRGATS